MNMWLLFRWTVDSIGGVFAFNVDIYIINKMKSTGIYLKKNKMETN